jgi:chromosome partitioning protein
LTSKSPRIIVFGNEKGGTGKSTLAMHVVIRLLDLGHRVGLIDLDSRQRSISRFLENRSRFSRDSEQALPSPEHLAIDASTLSVIKDQQIAEQAELEAALQHFKQRVDFIVIDCPGSYTYLSRLAHALADTLVTPINDSFVDLDLLGQVNPDSYKVEQLSHYSELVWESRKLRSASEKPPTDWVVTRNRLGMLDSLNNRRVDAALEALQKRIMFRYVPGLHERVIYRELFPKGLTMMDLTRVKQMGKMTVSQVSARSEVRKLVKRLNLDDLQPERQTNIKLGR